MLKLLHHSAIYSTPSDASIWCCSLSSSFFNGSCSTYTICLSGVWYHSASSLTCREKIPLKNPVPVSKSLYSSHILSAVSVPANLLFCIWFCNKVVYLLFYFIHSRQIVFNVIFFGLDLFCFVCLWICPLLCWLIFVSLCSVVVAVHSLTSLIKSVHFLALQGNCINTECPH